MRRREHGPLEGTQPTDLMYSAFDTTTYALGRVGSFIFSQPMILASIIFGVIGAIAGVRVAQYQEMQRRRNLYHKVMDSIGDIGGNIGDMFRGRRRGITEVFGERGPYIGPAMGMMPFMIGRRMGPWQTAKQARNVADLMPPAMTLLRNPLMRAIALRMLMRRMRTFR